MKLKINYKKFLKFILITSIPFTLNAQGIEQFISGGVNDSFLSSLPPDVRGDLLDGQNYEDPSIDAVDPKTRVTNLEASLKDAERTIDQIQSEINSKFSDADTDLRRFGKDFFSSYQSTFLHVNEGSGHLAHAGHAGQDFCPFALLFIFPPHVFPPDVPPPVDLPPVDLPPVVPPPVLFVSSEEEFCLGHILESGHLGQTGGTISLFNIYLLESGLK